jgi:uncharacterized membrane protein
MVTMIALLVILVITFIFIIGAGLVFLQMFRPKKIAPSAKREEQPQPAEKSTPKSAIRWSYFILPAAILLISVIITVYFYGKLPDAVAWRLNSLNSPTISRSQIALWAIIPQLLLALLALVIAYGAAKISDSFNPTADSVIKPDTVLIVMSNMVVVPQLVIIIAMLRIFSYNAFGTQIGFIWWVSLAIILAGVVFLTVFFVRLIQKMGIQSK